MGLLLPVLNELKDDEEKTDLKLSHRAGGSRERRVGLPPSPFLSVFLLQLLGS